VHSGILGSEAFTFRGIAVGSSNLLTDNVLTDSFPYERTKMYRRYTVVYELIAVG
jgi:hypothetical protein